MTVPDGTAVPPERILLQDALEPTRLGFAQRVPQPAGSGHPGRPDLGRGRRGADLGRPRCRGGHRGLRPRARASYRRRPPEGAAAGTAQPLCRAGGRALAHDARTGIPSGHPRGRRQWHRQDRRHRQAGSSLRITRSSGLLAAADTFRAAAIEQIEGRGPNASTCRWVHASRAAPSAVLSRRHGRGGRQGHRRGHHRHRRAAAHQGRPQPGQGWPRSDAPSANPSPRPSRRCSSCSMPPPARTGSCKRPPSTSPRD